jgi:hypothetical protein
MQIKIINAIIFLFNEKCRIADYNVTKNIKNAIITLVLVSLLYNAAWKREYLGLTYKSFTIR